jgi:hypothetical protein
MLVASKAGWTLVTRIFGAVGSGWRYCVEADEISASVYRARSMSLRKRG